MTFRVFSSQDEGKDYSDLSKFNIDTAVFFNGKTFIIFSDVINKGIIHRGYKTSVRDRKELSDWLASLEADTILMGFNSTKLDYQLLRRRIKEFKIDFKTIDLMDSIGLVAAEKFETAKPRFTLRQCGRWNSVKQTILPHFSWIFTTVELFDEWFNEKFRSVAKSLCAECEMIAKLGFRVRRKGEVRVMDPVSGKGIMMPMDFHDHILPKGFFLTVSPETEASE